MNTATLETALKNLTTVIRHGSLESLRVAYQASKAGVPFNLEVWQQMPHVFPIFSVLPESTFAIDRIAKFINDGELDLLPSRYGRHRPTRKEQRRPG